jgi:hypothetical protein
VLEKPSKRQENSLVAVKTPLYNPSVIGIQRVAVGNWELEVSSETQYVPAIGN